MEQNKKRYTKSFVDFDKVSTSKDGKKVIIHLGKMMISLHVNYLKSILNNLENPSEDASVDDFLPKEKVG
jgi:hypothetical protein